MLEGACQKNMCKRCIPKEGMPHAHKACQKKKERERKDVYPKKVCHMPTRRVKKRVKEKEKKRKRKYSPYQKKFIREKIHMKEFHRPSTKNIHTHAHIDQGL